jgi:hypothetical protein
MSESDEFRSRMEAAILGVLRTQDHFIEPGEIGAALVGLLSAVMAGCDGMGEESHRHQKCQEVAASLEIAIVDCIKSQGQIRTN